MHHMRRHLTAVFIIALVATAAAPGDASAAQLWKPEKNVEILVGTTPGSALDASARLMQKIWQERSLPGASSSVVNKPGGNMTVAAAYLQQRSGDAHYFQVISPTILTDHITGSGRFDIAEFTPVALLGSQYLAIATRTESPLKSGRDLVMLLKRDAGAASFGINGVGNSLHILVAAVGKAAGADVKKMRAVAFQGGELMTAALGGHVDVISTVVSNVLPHVATGKLRFIGIAAPERLGGALADTPTLREQGIDAVVRNWWAVIGAGGLTPAQLAWWDRVMAATTATPEWKSELARGFWDDKYLNSAETAAFLREEYARLRSALNEMGLAKR
jgi:putative tricarboxylic transport membrane protein